ncbi:MAG: stage II sporulation protein R [Syntrophothermus sp.]
MFRPLVLRLKVSGLIIMVAVVIAVIGAKVVSGEPRSDYAYTPGNLIRLHVIANSDLVYDQELKLQVRDAIIREAAETFRSAKTIGEARQVLTANLARIDGIARRTVAEAGYHYPVRTELGVFPFPAKAYGVAVLPAGNYEALRVVIGAGQGKNWWCVLFPPLCFVNLDSGLATRRVTITQQAPLQETAKSEQDKFILKFRFLDQPVSGLLQPGGIFPYPPVTTPIQFGGYLGNIPGLSD